MSKNKIIKVGIQGLRGAYHEVAAEQFFTNYLKMNIELVSFDIFELIYEALEKDEIDYGIVAIENSLMGSIYKNFDLLARYDYEIIGETYVHVQHQLLGLKNAKLSDIKEVYSQLPALAQVEHSLNDILPNVKKVEYFDTAASAKMVAEKQNKSLASIASKKAGEIYGLKVLKKNVEDDKENFTRFLAFTKKENLVKMENIISTKNKKEKYKTSLVFAGESKVVGFLFKCLACFSLRNINLTKIESRPIPKSPWNYYFYVDLEGSIEDEKNKKAIENLKEYCTMTKILGSYKIADK
jgi:chorismate mutase/prephenate dehydratase